jgi:sigma-B regulation protein RsbU (phosphoserine phosphatase)
MSDLRLLLVEDNPGDVRLLKEMLPSGYSLTSVDRLSAALGHCRQADVVLLDLWLPDSEGLETFRRLHAEAPDVAVLVLTGRGDESGAVLAVREGAQDWLVKGQVDGDGLARALRYAVERNQLTTRLRAVDAMRRVFLSVVSHDLKSPAAAVLAGIELISEGRLGAINDRQRHALELARRSIQRQTRLVEDLLDAAVIEAGALQLHPTQVSLAAIVRSAVEEAEPLLAERRLLAQMVLTPVQVWADPDRVAQIIENLLSNAVKHAHSVVGVHTFADDGHARVVVEDDGPGIPEVLVPRIFDQFVHADSPLAGSGIGLWIVRGLVERHGGHIRAENRADVPTGARFTVTLPCDHRTNTPLGSGESDA